MSYLLDILESNAELFADSIAVIDGGSDSFTSYRELWREIDAVAYGLYSSGVREGDRVAIHLPNGKEYIVSYFAILKIGAIAVPFNIQLKSEEIQRIMVSSGSRAIIITGEEVCEKITVLQKQIIIVVGQQPEGCTTIKFSEWLTGKGHIDAVALRDEQPAAIHYTSGSTGQMKGVVLTHKNITINSRINGHYLLGLNDQDKVLGVSPYSHVYFFQIVTGPLCVGASVVTLPRSSPKLVMAAIEKYQVTHFSTVPTMFRYLLEHNKETNHDLSSWRVAGTAGSYITPELFNEIQDTFGVELFDTYGSTETASTITYTRLRHTIPGSVGKPAHGYEVKLINASGSEVPIGEIGEITVKGPGVFSGYWDMPELSAKVMSNGWFKTGDLARQDQDGNLYIAGRTKDIIISGGYKIYPREIEEVLLSHPDIADAVVAGVPEENLGEITVGYVIVKPGAVISQEEVISFCEQHLSHYKVPRRVAFLKAFPSTASGKIIKALLIAPKKLCVSNVYTE